MAEQTIICPFCKKEIPLTQAITQKIEADLCRKMEEDFAKRDNELSGRENTLVAKEQAVAKSAQELNKKIEDERDLYYLSLEVFTTIWAHTSIHWNWTTTAGAFSI